MLYHKYFVEQECIRQYDSLPLSVKEEIHGMTHLAYVQKDASVHILVYDEYVPAGKIFKNGKLVEEIKLDKQISCCNTVSARDFNVAGYFNIFV
jgi:hypothetical protein